jgi:predicted CopG family antitoxin
MRSVKVTDDVWEKLMVIKALRKEKTISHIIQKLLDSEEIKYGIKKK